MSADTNTSPKQKGGWWSLSPLAVFLCLYLITSLLINDFYKVPITVAFLLLQLTIFTRSVLRSIKITFMLPSSIRKKVVRQERRF